MNEIRKKLTQTADVSQIIFKGLTDSQISDYQQNGQNVYQGKVRDVVSLNKSEILMVHSDRLSAFDCFIGYVPMKGRILTEMIHFWFQHLPKDFPHHYIRQHDHNTIVVENLQPFKVEVIVRSYMAGSMQRAYHKGERLFCGVKLPEGLKPYQKLPQLIITPTLKAAAFEHDEDTTVEELIQKNICSRQEWVQIEKLALTLFQFGSNILDQKGWILVDTKYEFGKDAAGNVKVIDEVHTPDSSRFWKKSSYAERLEKQLPPEMLDKENIRQYLIGKGFSGVGEVPHVPHEEFVKLALTYLEVLESLTSTLN